MQMTHALDHRLQHHAPFQGKAIFQHALPEPFNPEQAGIMRQKAKMASHVETQNRDIKNSEVSGSTQHGSITTEHHRQIR